MVKYDFAYPNHAIIDMYGVNPSIADDESVVRSVCRKIAEELNSKLVGEEVRKLEPHGLIYLVLLLQSHISYHSWPEKEYVAMDVYACSNVPVTKVLTLVLETFKPKRVKITLLDRKVEG